MLIAWKNIQGFEEAYQVSNTGKIWSVRYQRELKPSCAKGYLHVLISYKGERKTFLVHRLVAKAFVKGYKPGLEVNHIDGDKLNNNYLNLEWVTHGENLSHKFKVLKVENKGGIERIKVNQFLNGKIVNTFNSINEASRFTKIDASQISACIKKKPKYQTAGGYKWQNVM